MANRKQIEEVMEKCDTVTDKSAHYLYDEDK